MRFACQVTKTRIQTHTHILFSAYRFMIDLIPSDLVKYFKETQQTEKLHKCEILKGPIHSKLNCAV